MNILKNKTTISQVEMKRLRQTGVPVIKILKDGSFWAETKAVKAMRQQAVVNMVAQRSFISREPRG